MDRGFYVQCPKQSYYLWGLTWNLHKLLHSCLMDIFRPTYSGYLVDRGFCARYFTNLWTEDYLEFVLQYSQAHVTKSRTYSWCLKFVLHYSKAWSDRGISDEKWRNELLLKKLMREPWDRDIIKILQQTINDESKHNEQVLWFVSIHSDTVSSQISSDTLCLFESTSRDHLCVISQLFLALFCNCAVVSSHFGAVSPTSDTL